MDNPVRRAYRFGTFRVDLLRHQLIGPDGADLNLSARAYEVLIFLLEHRHRVVSREELMKAVWPRSVVEENNLNQAITILRRALGDRRDSPQFVRTIAGRGYRFVGEVSEEGVGPESEESTAQSPRGDPEPETVARAAEQRAPMPLPHHEPSLPQSEVVFGEGGTAPDPRRRRLLLGLGFAVVAAGGTAWLLQSRRTGERVAPLRSIAVLPFRPLVEGAGDPALEFGMADTLITRLSELPGLVVRPLSSVRRYAAAEQDPVQAGRELEAEAVLEGYVVTRANRVRVTARLLDVASGASLWSGSFEEPLDQFFAAQDALAGQVVSAMQIEMTARDRQQLLDRPTNDVRAWQLYLNGRYHRARATPEAFRRAVGYFEAAEKSDPAFALAVAGQAEAWAVLGVFSALPPAEAFARAGAAAERALKLAPDLPEAQAAMGHVLVQGRRDWGAGERLYRRALEAKPGYAQAHMWLANDVAYQGRLREALVEARRSQDLEPLSLTFAANVGLILYFMRDYGTALAQLGPIVEAAPEFPLARYHLARVLVASGAPERAIALLDGHRTLVPGALSNLARAHAATGTPDLARAQVLRLEEMGAQGLGVGFDLALIHAALGDSGSALDTLERAVRDGSQMIGFLNSEPGLDSIRDEPRFRAVSRQIGLG
jgi:DNA-binding winged helix-turn-helix (wHTH) protein/TolB-like protein